MARDERTGAYARNVSQEDWDLAHELSKRDAFGFGIKQLSESEKVAKQLASDHMLIWNKLVENKGPNELKKDQLNPDARLMELFKNESFKTFLEAKTLDAKMVALRDAGIVNNDIVKDEDLARTLMETISYSLTEDPNVQSKKPVNDMTEEEYIQFLADNKVPMNATSEELNKLHASTMPVPGNAKY